jgi:hypothetical protein
MQTTLKRDVKEIKKALRNNCWNVYMALPKGNSRRIIEVRIHNGNLQVKSISGVWYGITDYDCLYTA